MLSRSAALRCEIHVRLFHLSSGSGFARPLIQLPVGHQSASVEYIILGAPGHIEFLKNVIPGASRAEAALLVIDAREGIQENSRRHRFMLAMIGIRQIAVLVNKRGLVGYRRDVFDRITTDLACDLALTEVEAETDGTTRLKTLLHDCGAMFRPW